MGPVRPVSSEEEEVWVHRETPGLGTHREQPHEDMESRWPSASLGEASGETKPAGTLILYFQSPELEENKALWFKPRSVVFCHVSPSYVTG